MSDLRRFRGQGMIEYAIILSVVSLFALGGVISLGGGLTTTFNADMPIAQTLVCPSPTVGVDSEGRHYVQEAVRAETGLTSVTISTLTNATGSIVDAHGTVYASELPPLHASSYVESTHDTTNVVYVTATTIDQHAGSQLAVTISDGRGQTAACDPIFATVSAGSPQTFHDLEPATHVISLFNGHNNGQTVRLTVNSTDFQLALAPNQRTTVDVASAMTRDDHNRVTVRVTGDPKGSTDVLIADQ